MRHDSGNRSDACKKVGGAVFGTSLAPHLCDKAFGEMGSGGQNDVRFDLPPQFGGRNDRRMAERAEAQWRAALPLTQAANMPAFGTVDTGLASEFSAHALLLDLRRADRVEVVYAGAAIVTMFGIAPGYLASADAAGLAALLLNGCALMRLRRGLVAVDAVLGGTTSASLLTRGVLLPLADDDGRLSYIHGVLNWKQLLDQSARALLHYEIVAAVRDQDAHLHGFSGLGRNK